jgi:hypothetical protein
MNILIPLEITPAMIVSTSMVEPAAGETVWVSAGTYVLDDRRIRTTVHRKFKCIQPHTGRTALPENDPLFWEDEDPTAKFAPFDTYVSTGASSASPLNYVLNIGFFDGISAYGLVGSQASIVIKNGPGGAVLDTRTVSLYEESLGLYEYLFGPKLQKTKLLETGLTLHPTAEVTLTITGPSTVGIGMFNVGQYRTLVGQWGGTQYGASVEPTSTSRIKTDSVTGKVSIKRGNAATGMRASAVLDIADANYALQSIQQMLDVPLTIVASASEGYEGLNVFGLVNAVLSFPMPGVANLSINTKPMI